jgi:hypothetical protein
LSKDGTPYQWTWFVPFRTTANTSTQRWVRGTLLRIRQHPVLLAPTVHRA